MTQAFIALGANLGDPVLTLRQAVECLRQLPESTLTRASSLYRTAPVGLLDQPDFINGVVALETRQSADALLQSLFVLEAQFGRQRSIPNAPRTLDLDLLLYGDQIQSLPHLILPHPRMHERAFVLRPLYEIAPDLEIPGHGPLPPLLALCADQETECLPSSRP